MAARRTVSAQILKTSKKAASYNYDRSNYVVVDTVVRRDAKTGRLVTQNPAKK